MFDATDYEWKTDYAEVLAIQVAGYYPGVQAVMKARWLEYDGDDPSESMESKAARAAERVWHHMDPEMPVPQEIADGLATECTRVATEWFRERTTWARSR
jgi:hypothetical protein